MSFIKYPRTFHLPWSLGRTSDDKILQSINHFEGKEIVITEKMDGENTSIYKDGLHARSLTLSRHESRTMVTKLWAEIKHEIPENWRICGENLFAKHSIKYTTLENFFLVFSIWNDKNECLNWDETNEWCNLLNLTTVPILYRGVFDIDQIMNLENTLNLNTTEGYVIRLSDSFKFEDFQYSVAKFVRENHVQTDQHWLTASIEKNELISS